jgi:hypothetical protein
MVLSEYFLKQTMPANSVTWQHLSTPGELITQPRANDYQAEIFTNFIGQMENLNKAPLGTLGSE